MIKNLLLIFAAFTFAAKAQTVIYSQDFEGSHGWILNVVTGAEGADPNFFTVSDNEGGVTPPGCAVGTNGNKTLHVTSVFNPSGGASYDVGGLCGFLFCPQTDRRAESPVINCSGQTNISLAFDFISNGEGMNDNASVYYFDGSTWNLLVASLKSGICGNGQGQWTAYSIALPASANNNPNVKIAFRWVNNDDGVGADPSLAVNNVVLSSSQPLSISLASSTNVLCFGETTGTASVTVSGGQIPYTYDWTPNNPTGDGTASVSGMAAGIYTCTVQDGAGASVSQTVSITQPASAIAASQTLTLCAGQSVTVGTSAYSTSGTYTDTLTAINGCDSTVTTHLTINPVIAGSQTLMICAGQSVTVGTTTHSASGLYTDTLTAANGCDSVVTTNLTVENTIDTSVTTSAETITANATGVGYQWIDCDNGNAALPGETNQSFTASVNGNYAVVLTLNACADTSACVNISSVGLKSDGHTTNIRVYPNPSSGTYMAELSSEAVISINNALGEKILQTKLAVGLHKIDLHEQSNGMYFMHIQCGKTGQVIKLIKWE